MQERENVKKYYTELLQLEFEAEINNFWKPDKIALDKRIKEFMDRCQFTKYKSPNKPIKNNIVVSDENTIIHDQATSTKTGFSANTQRNKSQEIVMKEITNIPTNKPTKAIANATAPSTVPGARNLVPVNVLTRFLIILL